MKKEPFSCCLESQAASLLHLRVSIHHSSTSSLLLSLLCYPVPKYHDQSTPPTVRPPQEEAPSVPHSPKWHEGILHHSSTSDALQVIYPSHVSGQTLQYCAIPSYLEIVQHTVRTRDDSLIAKTAISCSPADLNKFLLNQQSDKGRSCRPFLINSLQFRR